MPGCKLWAVCIPEGEADHGRHDAGVSRSGADLHRTDLLLYHHQIGTYFMIMGGKEKMGRVSSSSSRARPGSAGVEGGGGLGRVRQLDIFLIKFVARSMGHKSGGKKLSHKLPNSYYDVVSVIHSYFFLLLLCFPPPKGLGAVIKKKKLVVHALTNFCWRLVFFFFSVSPDCTFASLHFDLPMRDYHNSARQSRTST